MLQNLVIRIPSVKLESNTLVDWALYSGSDLLQASGNAAFNTVYDLAVENSADKQSNFSVTLIVPGEAVNLLSPSIPSRQVRQIKQALPFMIEEQIAADVETVHIALPKSFNPTHETVDVALVSHALLIDWLDALHSHQLSPQNIVIDILCVPQQANTLTILLDGNRVLLRSGPCTGMVIDISDFALIFPSWLASQQSDSAINTVPSVNIIAHNSVIQGDSKPEIFHYISENYPDYSLKLNVYQEPITEILCATALARSPEEDLNLLQGGYAVSATEVKGWQRWQMAASVAGVALVIYLAITGLGGMYFESRAQSLESQSVELYKQLFPNERRVVSPRKQMENHLRLPGGIADDRFLRLLSETAQQFSKSDVNDNLLVNQMRFETQQGELQFQAESPSIEQLDRLKQELAKAGLDVNINSATEQSDHVIGRFVIRSQ